MGAPFIPTSCFVNYANCERIINTRVSMGLSVNNYALPNTNMDFCVELKNNLTI